MKLYSSREHWLSLPSSYLRVVALSDIVQHLVEYVHPAHTGPHPPSDLVSGLEDLKGSKPTGTIQSKIELQNQNRHTMN